ncbi:VWA domain-containing protein [Paenibacillus sp. N1-5-1-14]|uniref:vWA domain-containing protein n=1 Tax=Paenibacillus radicibacter TaxID=2972488 RepID=UPI00215918DF|nr:vWA domain-containing protein [Paenibacillus radicibacter]MCR8644709.1 VWA domain-containing protein [Paenibacillus radicibacter]
MNNNIIKGRLLPMLLVIVLLFTQPLAMTVAATNSDTKIDAVLSVDVSSSMDKSDVNKISYEAMKLFVDMASVQGDKIGIIAYTDQILREKALLKINSAQDKKDLKTFIDQLTRGPYTDIAVGVSEAVKVLESGREQGHVPMIVLLSDGNNSLNTGKKQEQSDKELEQALQQAKANGIPIYTIGLNADGKLNKSVLERISSETNGKMFETSSADDLPQILSEIYASHLKLKVVPLTGFTASGAFQEVKVNIPNSSVLEANISIMSNKPVEVKLVDPVGVEQKIPSDQIVYSASNAYSLVKILKPTQGEWTLKVKGVPQEKIDINLIYNYDLQVSMEVPSSISVKPGDTVPIKAHLESNGQKVTDTELYKNAKASLLVTDLDTKKTEEIPLTVSDQGITGSVKLAEAHEYDLKVKVEDTNYVRESQSVKISAKPGGATTTPAPGNKADEAKDVNWIARIGWIVGAVVLLAAACVGFIFWKKANKGFFGQMIVEIKDEDTGERTTPQYKKLNGFKGQCQLHQLLQMAPEFAETKQIVFKPGAGDTVVLYNQSSCVIEKGGRVFDATQGKQLNNKDRIRITLQNVNKSITIEYIK